ncbi:MAG: glycosyltransferase [Cyclobacteriaceae bacterium]
MTGNRKLNIAILTSNENAYSETFIQAHRERLDGNIYFFYGGTIPNQIEGSPIKTSPIFRAFYKAIGNYTTDFLLFEKKALGLALRKHRIDVVLAEYGPIGAQATPICKSLNLPLIVHFHGYDATQLKILETYSSRYKAMFEYVVKVIAVSSEMLQQLKLLGCPEKKLCLNPYGPHEDFVDLEPAFSELLLLTVGRFTNKKAPYYVVLAFAKALKNYPEAKLIMAGNGPLKESCENLVRYLDIQSNVTFPGVISPEEFRNFLSKSRGFIQHSIRSKDGDMEGTPVAILEASGAGLPVISTKHGGIMDVIIHEETGYLVDEHDVIGMTDCIVKILEDRTLAVKLGANGKERISQKFSMSRHIDEINRIIRHASK